MSNSEAKKDNILIKTANLLYTPFSRKVLYFGTLKLFLLIIITFILCSIYPIFAQLDQVLLPSDQVKNDLIETAQEKNLPLDNVSVSIKNRSGEDISVSLKSYYINEYVFELFAMDTYYLFYAVILSILMIKSIENIKVKLSHINGIDYSYKREKKRYLLLLTLVCIGLIIYVLIADYYALQRSFTDDAAAGISSWRTINPVAQIFGYNISFSFIVLIILSCLLALVAAFLAVTMLSYSVFLNKTIAKIFNAYDKLDKPSKEVVYNRYQGKAYLLTFLSDYFIFSIVLCLILNIYAVLSIIMDTQRGLLFANPFMALLLIIVVLIITIIILSPMYTVYSNIKKQKYNINSKSNGFHPDRKFKVIHFSAKDALYIVSSIILPIIIIFFERSTI